MSEFIRLPEVRIEGIEANIYMEPSLVEVDGKYRIHHITVSGVLYPSNKFVPLEHLSKRRRKVVDVELENQRLRELCEMAASKLDTEEVDDETTGILSAMREIGIEVRG